MRALLFTFAALLSSSVAAAPKGGTVKGTINVLAKGAPKADKSKVVVYLEDVPGDPPKPKNATIRQIEKQFDPPLTTIVSGGSNCFSTWRMVAFFCFGGSPGTCSR